MSPREEDDITLSFGVGFGGGGGAGTRGLLALIILRAPILSIVSSCSIRSKTLSSSVRESSSKSADTEYVSVG